MNEGELKLVELDPDKQYVIMFRGNAYNFRWPDKPANVSDILLNADHYTIEDLEMALEALKKGGQMDSSKEFEEVLRGSINGLTYFHSEADIPGVEEYNPSQAEQRILAAHHKATQARAREVLQGIKAQFTHEDALSRAELEHYIDAELAKLGEQE